MLTSRIDRIVAPSVALVPRRTAGGYSLLDRAARGTLDVLARAAGYRVVTGAPAEDRDRVRREVTGALREVPADLRHVGARYARQETILVAYHRGRPVGALSLFTPDARCRTLEAWPVALPAGVGTDQALDIGRLLIARAHRGGARFALLCLLAAAQRHSERLRRPYWIGVTSPALLRMFRRMNPSARPLPAAERPAGDDAVRRYWDAYRADGDAPLTAFIMRPDAGAPSVVLGRHIAARWSRG